MKYALIIPDGCADEPQPLLNGRTPLQAALLPNMDEIARLGVVGQADNTPPSLPSGSDVATMSLFGYDPLRFHTGRAPIEAAAQGIPLGPDDWAIRCNLVSVVDDIMVSFTSGQIPNDLAAHLVRRLQEEIGSRELEFFSGVSYRNLLIDRRAGAAGNAGSPPFDRSTKTTPPHDITDQNVTPFLPSGTGSEQLRSLMLASQKLLAEDPENQARKAAGHPSTTTIWLWGQGQRPNLQRFVERFGVAGAMITAVDLLRGLAQLLGWKNIAVPGATGYLDTDYAAKGQYAVEALRSTDLVVVHVEATDEASHEGDVSAKVRALEEIDRHIVGPVHAALKTYGDYRILVSPDHPTFLRTKTHSYGFVPFASCGKGIAAAGAESYDEVAAAAGALKFPNGFELMPWFVGSSSR